MATKQKILIVEDETQIRKALVEKLQAKYEVYEAENGNEGLKAAKNKLPNLILLDILMPKMDGIEMMNQLRASDWGKDMKIIIFTNLDSDDRILGAITKGEPAYYLIKSNTDIHEVEEKIRDVLSDK